MKRRSAPRHTPREIAELLESDDEYPDTYDEIPDMPAYLNDNRFTNVKPVEYDEINQNPEENQLQTKLLKHQNSHIVEKISSKQSSPEKLKATTTPQVCVIPEQTARPLNNKQILISKGVMTKRDIFFIKSIEEYATDETLLWFVDFLNSKAVKPYPRSCLVADVMDHHSTPADTLSDFKKRYYLKLVVK